MSGTNVAVPTRAKTDNEFEHDLNKIFDKWDGAQASLLKYQRQAAQLVIQWGPTPSKLQRWCDKRGVAYATVTGWVALERAIQQYAPVGFNDQLSLGAVARVLDIKVPEDDADKAEAAEEARRELLTGPKRTEHQMAVEVQRRRIQLGQEESDEPAEPAQPENEDEDDRDRHGRKRAAAKYKPIIDKIDTSTFKGRFYVADKLGKIPPSIVFDVFGEVTKDMLVITVGLYDRSGPLAVSKAVAENSETREHVCSLMVPMPETEAASEADEG